MLGSTESRWGGTGGILGGSGGHWGGASRGALGGSWEALGGSWGAGGPWVGGRWVQWWWWGGDSFGGGPLGSELTYFGSISTHFGSGFRSNFGSIFGQFLPIWDQISGPILDQFRVNFCPFWVWFQA